MDELLSKIDELKQSGAPFAIATVIHVKGSASARPGSKALINQAGKNVYGWVGGGCAESFVAKNALEAMEEGRTRIIQADLDDEIFGLGMPCGGIMDVYIEPHLPPEKIELSEAAELQDVLLHLAENFGFKAHYHPSRAHAGDIIERVLMALGQAIAMARGKSFRALKEVKNVFPKGAVEHGQAVSELVIVGSSRITEELAKLGVMLKWPVRVFGWNLSAENYPRTVKLEEADPGHGNFKVARNAVVIVASHHKGDPQFIQRSLSDGAQYVGLIASGKRSGIIMEHLQELQLSADQISKVHAPAGLEIDCRNPSEIALSTLCEVIQEKNAV